MQSKLSAVIITLNEEKNIERCVLSAQKVADEVIVLDSFSTDNTVAICEGLNVKVHQQKWLGYAEQKNLANSYAINDYVLSLDADEALSKELEAEILKLKSNGLQGVYSFNRLTNYCGTWVRHTSWYPDVKIRIFNKNVCEWSGSIHEELVCKNQRITHIKGDLLHYSFYTRKQHLMQIEKFSSIAANDLHEKGQSIRKVNLYLKVVARFVKNYLLKLGFLDGRAGFDVSRYSAYATYLRYSKLRALNKNKLA